MLVFHVDVNSAYLSWTAADLIEKGYGMDIRNMPAVISGNPENRHGIILAKSIAAKKFGIKTGESLFEAKQKCPELKVFAPDYDLFMRFQDAAHGLIKVVTISPELDGAVEFTRKVSALGVRVSIGHSSASYEQAMACIDAGAASTTHTMNAMKLLHMHDPAILTAVLESDIYCEMICDGFHLHPPIVRLLVKIKGTEKMIPITDSMMAAGYPDGFYMLGVNKVKVENGDAKLVDNGVRAGSTLTMQKALLNILSFTGLSLEQAVPMLSANAPRMLGLYETTGSIEKGKRADITLLDQNNTVVATFVCGKQVFGKPLV